MNKIVLFISLICCSFTAAAKPELHLLFHMGLGMNGQFFVGGTLHNKGDEPVYQGYVVVTPLTRDCYPQQPQMWQFKQIAANEKTEFRIPVTGKLHGYKLDHVHAVDSFGNPLEVVDETAEVLQGKQATFIEKCQQQRGAQPNADKAKS